MPMSGRRHLCWASGPARIVLGVGTQSGQMMPAVPPWPWPSVWASHRSPSPAVTMASSTTPAPSPPPCVRSWTAELRKTGDGLRIYAAAANVNRTGSDGGNAVRSRLASARPAPLPGGVYRCGRKRRGGSRWAPARCRDENRRTSGETRAAITYGGDPGTTDSGTVGLCAGQRGGTGLACRAWALGAVMSGACRP